MTMFALLTWLVLGAPAAADQDPRAGAKGTGRIAGRVVSAEGARPIPYALVRLVRWEGGLGQARSGFTDVHGRFDFAELLAGSYQITASAEGFVTLEYDQKQPPQPGRRIDLADGQQFDKADFQLPRTSAVEGHVFDEFGDPAPGIRIQIARVDFAAGRTRLMPAPTPVQSTTDDKGAFRVFGLSAGDYYVLALSGLFAGEDRAGFAPTFFPGTTVATEAQPVRVDVGRDVSGLSIRLAPSRQASVSGSVLGVSGQPSPTVTVRLWQTHGGDVRAIIPADVRTGPDGRFTFRNVPAGTYVLQASGPARSFASRTLVVDASPVTDLVLPLRAGVAARGRIVFDGDAVLPPAERVRVTLRRIEFVNGPVGGGPPPSQTRADWTFEIGGLIGTGMLRVDPPPPWKLARVTLAGDDVTDKPLTFQDRDIENLEITLTSRFGAISGRVLDAQGQPTAQGVVIAFAEEESKLAFPSRFISLARPDDQGRFTFAGLAPSTYLLVALPGIQGTEWEDPAFLRTLRPSAAKVVIVEGTNLTQDVKLSKLARGTASPGPRHAVARGDPEAPLRSRLR